MDLVCLVADKNIKAAITQLFERHESLGVGPFKYEVVTHPERDPGCFHQSDKILNGYRSTAQHALVIFDYEWTGVPVSTGLEVENLLECSLNKRYEEGWAKAVVIEPELEAWVFGTSHHVAKILGWPSNQDLRSFLTSSDLWTSEEPKPSDPKAALEAALGQKQIPRSSSIYRKLAEKVSLKSCTDRSFVRLKSLLKGWFG